MKPPPPGLAKPLLALGQVRHTRLRPVVHAFGYPTYFLLLPLRSLRAQADAALVRNRRGLLTFHDADHGAGGPDALAWVENLLRNEGVTGADGEIWLQCYPRVLGFAFKPVSFWWCHSMDGTLRAMVVEVNNTFGERHIYLLNAADLAMGREARADKVFHVSPFCAVAGEYRFRFMRTAPSSQNVGRVVARVDLHDEGGALIQTSVSGHLQTLTAQSARSALLRQPLMTLGVVFHIHSQALRLWIKRVPWFRKPAPPSRTISLQSQPLSQPLQSH